MTEKEIKNTLAKKAINVFVRKADTMETTDFRQNVVKIIDALLYVAKEAKEQGKIDSERYYNLAEKEINVLSKMIENEKFTEKEKKDFSKRIAKIVKSFREEKIINKSGWIVLGGAIAGIGIGTLVGVTIKNATK